MRRLILRLSAMPAVILAKMGNADINRVTRYPYSIPVLRRFDKLVSPPLKRDSDGLEERQLDTALGAIYNNLMNKLVNLATFLASFELFGSVTGDSERQSMRCG